MQHPALDEILLPITAAAAVVIATVLLVAASAIASTSRRIAINLEIGVARFNKIDKELQSIRDRLH